MLKKTILSVLIAMSSSLSTFAQTEVMLQGFYWDGYSDCKWKKLEKQADELANYFDYIWVPNSGNCGGGTNMGYLPLYYWDQNSSFGTEDELRSMIKTFKEKGLGTIADVVINHHNTSNGWFGFPKETYKGEAYQFQSTDICKNDDGGAALAEANAQGISISSNNDTGDGWDGCRDLDHKSDNVNKIIKAYLKYLIDDLGYTGFRYDMVKGYSASFITDYNTASHPAFSVGEYWDGSSAIKKWIDGTKDANGVPASSAFDFQFRYRVRDAINQNNWNLLAGNASDAAGYPLVYQEAYRPYAVTFVENHDTEKRPSANQDPIKADTLAANAYLLAMPGTPCVFLKHWTANKSDIKRMISARQLAGITSTSKYEQLKSAQLYYAVKTTGTKGTLICVVGKTPSAYAAPAGYTQVCSGKGFIYYLSNDAASGWEAIEKQISDEEKAAEAEKEQFTPHTATIYVKADFTPVYFYIWDSNNNSQLNGNWPGKQPATTTINGETWYCQTVNIDKADYYFNIIFNQGNNKPQTADITELKEDHYYEATLSGSKVNYKDVTSAVSISSPVVDGESSEKPIYDLTGRKIATPLPGRIYIQNNKKIIIK